MGEETNLEKVKLKDYSKYSDKKLNKIKKLRDRQIASYENGLPTTDKTLAQLKYERDAIVSTMLERAMTNA